MMVLLAELSDPSTWVGIVGGVAAVVVSTWTALRRSRREETQESRLGRREEQVAEDEMEEKAIQRWQRIVRDQEKRHSQVVERMDLSMRTLRSDFEELRRKEQECQVRTARQEEQITNLRDDLNEMRRVLRDRGFGGFGTDEHPPLYGPDQGQVDRRTPGTGDDYHGPERRSGDQGGEEEGPS